VCALARVSFTYLHITIYTPQMKFLATPQFVQRLGMCFICSGPTTSNWKMRRKA